MSLHDDIYKKMKADVFTAIYKPNELIVERDIARKYGVSKITAGKVLHRLCNEGHLTSYPRSGYMVTMLTAREMQQLKRLRIRIESLVLEILHEEGNMQKLDALSSYIMPDFGENDSASAINNAFHMAMARETDDKYIITLMESLLGTVSRVEQPVAYEQLEGWQEYHQEILDALKSGDLEQARKKLIEDINQR